MACAVVRLSCSCAVRLQVAVGCNVGAAAVLWWASRATVPSGSVITATQAAEEAAEQGGARGSSTGKPAVGGGDGRMWLTRAVLALWFAATGMQLAGAAMHTPDSASYLALPAILQNLPVGLAGALLLATDPRYGRMHLLSKVCPRTVCGRDQTETAPTTSSAHCTSQCVLVLARAASRSGSSLFVTMLCPTHILSESERVAL
jgi:hypothetical protein